MMAATMGQYPRASTTALMPGPALSSSSGTGGSVPFGSVPLMRSVLVPFTSATVTCDWLSLSYSPLPTRSETYWSSSFSSQPQGLYGEQAQMTGRSSSFLDVSLRKW